MVEITKLYLMNEDERRATGNNYATGLVLETSDGQRWLHQSTDVLQPFGSWLLNLPHDDAGESLI